MSKLRLPDVPVGREVAPRFSEPGNVQVRIVVASKNLDGEGAADCEHRRGPHYSGPPAVLSWRSPLAAALLGARVGDTVTFRSPRGDEEFEVVALSYGGPETGG